MIKRRDLELAEQCLLFIHIPKTAGTSFRTAGLQYFGHGHVLFDYGEGSAATSKKINELVYVQDDLYSLKRFINDSSVRLLSGHYLLSKYAKIFPLENVVTFVRDPVQQVISHYYHYQRLYHYKDDMLTFCQEPRFQNLQSQYLSYSDLELIGFVGVTEKYNESLDYINHYYNLKIAFTEVNQNNNKKKKFYDVDDEIKKVILDNNKKDALLYEKAKKLHALRLDLLSRNKDFVYGAVMQLTENSVQGWAVNPFTVQAVEIEVVVNNKVIEVVEAKEYRPRMKEKNCARNSFVGFSYQFGRNLLPEDYVVCRVKETQQIL